MAKSKMNIKRKSVKRERNKSVTTVETKDEIKSFFITIIAVLAFVGLMYLGVLGLKALGLFEEGYTVPTKDAAEISYENISIGTVFDRKEKEYYVVFDKFEGSKNDKYVDYLVSKTEKVVYKVDMSSSTNSSHAGSKSNPKATKSSELVINGLTLIKIKGGKIAKYLTNAEDIEKELK